MTTPSKDDSKLERLLVKVGLFIGLGLVAGVTLYASGILGR